MCTMQRVNAVVQQGESRGAPPATRHGTALQQHCTNTAPALHYTTTARRTGVYAPPHTYTYVHTHRAAHVHAQNFQGRELGAVNLRRAVPVQ